jgi:hypothetical protein
MPSHSVASTLFISRKIAMKPIHAVVDFASANSGQHAPDGIDQIGWTRRLFPDP